MNSKEQEAEVIVVDHIKKDFVLPHERVNSLKASFTSLLKKKNKQKDTQHALKDISFTVHEGEFFGIVGRNGSGKSTLLKILAKIYQPTAGSISTSGRLVPFIELGVGFNPELSGRDNVFLNGAMLGFSKKETAEMYDDIVDFAELRAFMDQKLKNYSSGMQVRLAFSMATRAKADILLLDEVLAVGDGDFQRKCFEYFRTLKKNKKTVVFVSHDMSAIREYCDRAILVEGGKIIFSDTAEEVAKEYTKLFMPKADVIALEQGKWGAGGVDIVEIKPSKKVLKQSDSFLDITVKIQILENFDNGIIPGITIKNQAGKPLCGINSKLLRMENPRPKKDQIITVTWHVPNIFNEGRLILEPAVAHGSNAEICQWWDNATSIQVINEQKTPYPVAPSITMQLDKSTEP